ncbi:DUF4190 domain-containing protein [Nocardia sp. NEAU-G5]|uniref:DUF4190 domain-containing protein n=1 Tax=Nocardia albiluteola TaxID=2842303 RepID=A0ABS6ASQ3_9NOCA|nr:DUF4190 domain-containing protein [Nocardia albiluteola]MBU3060043.1 DUF4190 domain-containing protein [Nocardia albiluteola]
MTEYPPPGQYPSAQGPGGGYPPPPSEGYPMPPGEQYRPQGGRGLAVTALVLGVLALLSTPTVLGGVFFGLLGLLFGIIATVKARRGTATGGGMAITGLILAVLGLAGGIVVGIVAGNWLADHGGRDYMDCVKRAGNDQSQVQKCADEWRSSLQNTPTPVR